MQQQNPLEAKRKAEDKIKKLKDDYEKVFGTEAGQRVLEDIKVSGYYTRSSFSQTSPYVTSHNEGKRELALHIEYMATPLPEESKENKKAITGGKE